MDEIRAKLTQYEPQMLSILRIVMGLMFLSHGTVKWFGFPAPNPAFANITLMSMVGAAGVIEIVCGSLVTVGLFTRAASFLISGQMAVAYWYVANRPARGFAPIINGGTAEVLYCFIFLYFVFAGAGPWSLDATLRNRVPQRA